ncbi:MAG: NAD-dependent epimerase/dehydratase family protein [Verrucomicrobiia bacterium]
MTGATGFLGGHFLRAAMRRGHRIVALRRPGSTPRVPLESAPDWIEGDLDSDLTSSIKSCDAMVHLAAYGVSPQPCEWAEALRQNVHLPAALFESIVRTCGVENVVVAGSCTEYGLASTRYDEIPTSAPLEPVEPYATSKAAFSLFFRAFASAHAISGTLLRPFHIYGEGQYEGNFWPQLHRAARAGEDFRMSPGEQMRDFLEVKVAAELFVDAVENPAPPGEVRVENLGSGRPVTLAAFARQEWEKLRAPGQLLLGALPYRAKEMMRFIPKLSDAMKERVKSLREATPR